MAIYIRKLRWLVVDQNKDAVIGRKKCVESNVAEIVHYSSKNDLFFFT